MRVFLSVVLVLVSVISLFSVVDENAIALYDETFQRAIYSFALAKGLNAVISVLQSSEVSLGFVVGATLGVGQVLDPINDLVERFSMIMLISSISLGVQHLLLILGKSVFIKVALALFAFVVMIALWVKKIQASVAFVWGVKIVALLFLLRFGAVIFVYSNHFLYQEVYAKEYQSASEFINNYKFDLQRLEQEQKVVDSSLGKLQDKSEVFSSKVIKLATIFIVSTVLFPLAYLWLFVLLIRLIITKKLTYDIITPLIHKDTQ
jgi:hypothetical protein